MVIEQNDRTGERHISAPITSIVDERPTRTNDVSRFRHFARFGVTLFAAVTLLMVPMTATTVSAEKEFDVTGTLDCGIRSGQQCHFDDWDAGPMIGMFTKDISGTTERFVVDASWMRDHLTAFRQDDFVWFQVRDGIGSAPVIVSVVEHRCFDGRYPHGQVNHGLSTRDACR